MMDYQRMLETFTRAIEDGAPLETFMRPINTGFQFSTIERGTPAPERPFETACRLLGWDLASGVDRTAGFAFHDGRHYFLDADGNLHVLNPADSSDGETSEATAEAAVNESGGTLLCVFCDAPGRIRAEGFAPECDVCASQWED